MSYNDILKKIIAIKANRIDFISKFEIEYEFVYDSLIEAVNNNNINSIRIHKYLTDNKKLGKVQTARFLHTIDLDESTKIFELNKEHIIKIAKYSCHK